MVALMRAWRSRLEDATGRPVRFSWWLRMDPQVTESYGSPGWVAERYGRELDELRHAGDEIGLHPHAWRWDREERHWIADHGSSDWIQECLTVSFDAYESAFGVPCATHRFGSHFISRQIVDFLRERGVPIDLTVEPGTRPTTRVGGASHSTGAIPDQTHAPRAPYLPDPLDPMRAANPGPRVSGEAAAGPWMIPLTAINPEPLYPPIRRAARRLRRACQTRHRTAQLWEPGDPRVFWRLVETESLSRVDAYLVFATRTEVPLVREFGAAFRQKLELLEAGPLIGRVEFVNPAAVVERAAQPRPASEA